MGMQQRCFSKQKRKSYESVKSLNLGIASLS